jgi:rubrerythrin
MDQLELFTCTSCGFVSTINFRDRWCPVCKVCEKVDRIFIQADEIHISPASHEK